MGIAGTPSVHWVCVDCYFTHHGVFEVDAHGTPDREPLSLIDEAAEVTAGMVFDEHECGRENGEEIDECDCERIEFSSSSCDGCGSHLAGSREALTVWTLAA